MLKNSNFSIGVVSVYLLIYIVLLNVQASPRPALLMLSFAPFLLIWMVYTVLRYGKYSGRELRENEEWAYGDVDKEDLGIF